MTRSKALFSSLFTFVDSGVSLIEVLAFLCWALWLIAAQLQEDLKEIGWYTSTLTTDFVTHFLVGTSYHVLNLVD